MMKKYYETLHEVDNRYVINNYFQIMLSYQNHLLLFGNEEMMYYKNIQNQSSKEFYTNLYLNDNRRFDFPFSNIPEHTERNFFKKINFTNQILELEKPYIKLRDGQLIKMIAFKENNKTYLHSRILTDNMKTKKIIVNRKELENYLQKGYFRYYKEKEFISEILDYIELYPLDKYKNTLEYKQNPLEINHNNISNQQYSLIKIFDLDGILYPKNILTQEEIIKKEQEVLYDVLENISPNIKNKYFYGDKIVKELHKSISALDEIEPFDLISPKLMIKIESDKDINIDIFAVKYLSKDKYEVMIKDVPLPKENLLSLQTNFSVKKLKTTKPKIKTLS